MPRNVALRPSAIVACSIAILCCPVVARAQAVDGFDPGANQTVYTIAVQPDGKTVVGGNFTGLGGGTGTTTRNRIGRLNVDGTVDASFNPGTNGPVHAVAVQPDGKILAGGNFTSVGGGTGMTTARSHIARFNADGTVDTSFNPGANVNVYALAVQPDGKILVGGNFSTLGAAAPASHAHRHRAAQRRRLARHRFNPGASKSVRVPCQSSTPSRAAGREDPGRRLLQRARRRHRHDARNFLGRLNADGTVDQLQSRRQFDQRRQRAGAPGRWEDSWSAAPSPLGRRRHESRATSAGSTPTARSTSASIQARKPRSSRWAVQTDGKILAGGYFKWLGDAGGPLQVGAQLHRAAQRRRLGRLHLQSRARTTWSTPWRCRADGAIVVGGIFDRLGAAATRRATIVATASGGSRTRTPAFKP